MERLAAKPTAGVPQACRGWGGTIAAYRFFDNEEVQWATILEPHWRQTRQRMAAHLRTLLIHGARAVLRTAPTKHDKKHAWALALQARRGINRAIVAMANKMARVIWALLASGQSYQKAM